MPGSDTTMAAESVGLSVIICTYNRAHNLDACIGYLLDQQSTDGIRWEIVLVDNNSSDETAEVVKRLAEHSPVPIRYVFEPQQGLSFARNRGIEETRSEFMVFTDDDIHVGKEWVSSIYRTFKEQVCDAVGGPIHLNLDAPLPAWIQPEMQGFLGYRDFGEQLFRMNGRTEFPFGGNMAFRRDVLIRCGDFDTKLGRVGEGRSRKELFKGEETDIFHRLADQGAKIYYHPDALVLHNILPHQLKKSFFRVLHFNSGYQRATLGQLRFKRSVQGVPFYLFLSLSKAIGKYLYQAAAKGPSFAFRQQMNVGYFLGMILGCWRSRERTT